LSKQVIDTHERSHCIDKKMTATSLHSRAMYLCDCKWPHDSLDDLGIQETGHRLVGEPPAWVVTCFFHGNHHPVKVSASTTQINEDRVAVGNALHMPQGYGAGSPLRRHVIMLVDVDPTWVILAKHGLKMGPLESPAPQKITFLVL
jgi:hypothetical protein